MRHAPYICGESCPKCQEREEAFEAMREALYTYVKSGHTRECLRSVDPCTCAYPQANAALALADKVSIPPGSC